MLTGTPPEVILVLEQRDQVLGKDLVPAFGGIQAIQRLEVLGWVVFLDLKPGV